MSEENKAQDKEDEQPRDEHSAEAGPPEDVENDPAYNPDDPGLKAAKGA
jgi:hypothetical protein